RWHEPLLSEQEPGRERERPRRHMDLLAAGVDEQEGGARAEGHLPLPFGEEHAHLRLCDDGDRRLRVVVGEDLTVAPAVQGVALGGWAAATSFAAAPLRLPAPLSARTVRLPILMYHRIDLLTGSLPPITRRLTVDPHDFAAQMAWLKGHGYHAVTELQAFDA